MHTLKKQRNRTHDIVNSEKRFAALQIARELEQILASTGPKEISIRKACVSLGKSKSQIYVLLKKYRSTRTVSSLISGRRVRKHRLDPSVEHIIESTLRTLWMVPGEPDLNPVVAEIAARCEEAGLRPPAYGTVQDRIPQLFTPTEIAKRRSTNRKHVRRLQARPGYITADGPLDVAQIDHTPSDINFVEVAGEDSLFVGRAYLTIVTDVFSKCILGFCLTLEKPSTLSIALCLSHAICKKRDWLDARGISHAWETFGRMKKLVVDMGPEFRSDTFAQACDEYNIKIKRRNRGTVHTGGVVERLLGKLNHEVGRLDGRTGRSVADRDGYPSEARACLSFQDLEKCIALAVIDHNNEINKKTLKVPIKEWMDHIPDQSRFDDTPETVLFNFLPTETRVLTPQGISMFALDYYSHWLGAHVPDRDVLGKMHVKYDKRDISYVYVRDPQTKLFRPVERRDGNRAPITLWQHQSDRSRKRRESSRSWTQKVAIRREMKSIVDVAKRKKPRLPLNKPGSREHVRAIHAAGASKPYQTMKPVERPAEPHSDRPRRILTSEEW